MRIMNFWTIVVSVTLYVSISTTAFCDGTEVKNSPFQSYLNQAKRLSDFFESNRRNSSDLKREFTDIALKLEEELKVMKEYVSYTLDSMRPDRSYEPRVGFFKLFPEPKNWYDARQACIADGTHLATVDSEDKAQILSDIVMNAEQEILRYNNYSISEAWVGTHKTEDGDWVSIFNEPSAGRFRKVVDNKKWNCAHVRSSSYSNSGMNNDDCGYEMSYICELYL